MIDEGLEYLKGQKSHNKAEHTFGSVEKRFPSVLKERSIGPGPGEYMPERSLIALDNMKNDIMP